VSDVYIFPLLFGNIYCLIYMYCFPLFLAIVLMLMFRKITEGENAIHVVSFTIYILVVQWATDVVFLYILLPEISSVNELALQLHVITANQRWVEEVPRTPGLEDEDVVGSMGENVSDQSLATMEANRYDTLHRIIAQPIRYTIASIYFTKNGARNQLFGVVGAVLFSFMRVLLSLMLD
jgi:hypothetical protein